MRTVTLNISAIKAVADARPPGYEAEVMAAGRVVGESLVLGAEDYDRLRRKYSSERPWWVEIIVRFRTAGDIGPGDTVERLVKPIGGETFKAAFKRVFGFECGCSDRRDNLNSKYPYSQGGFSALER